jgi:hypothetical protein
MSDQIPRAVAGASVAALVAGLHAAGQPAAGAAPEPAAAAQPAATAETHTVTLVTGDVDTHTTEGD